MMMTRQDRAEYLANVLSVAAVDDTVTREEAAVLRSVVERVGADANDMLAARGLLEGAAAYTLRLPDDKARRLANIEDMVLMALGDGTLTTEESALIERLLAGQGFAQADMDMIVRRAEKRVREIVQAAESAPPPSPAAPPHPASSSRPPPLPAKPDAAPLPRKTIARTVVPPRAPAPPMRTRGQAPASARPAAPAVPALASAAPLEAPRQPPAPPSAPAPAAVVAATPPEDPMAACRRRREASPCGRTYCFGAPDGALNPWGCRLLDMDWSARADWLRLGAFRDSDTFVLDREAMRARLAANMPAVRTCPHFSAAVALAAAGALPSRATTAGRWRHHKAETGETGAVPIAVREYRHGCDITSMVMTDGMAPTDGRDALLIMRRAVAAAGAGPLDWKALAEQAVRL